MLCHLRRIAAAFVLAASAAAVTADQSGVTPRASAGPVAIEFFASGPDGVISNLRADELSLKVDGRDREIRSLRFISLPSSDPSAPPSLPMDVPFGSNMAETGGRWVSIVVDQESIRAGGERNAMAAAVRFVNALGPRDQVAYFVAPQGGVRIEFTTEHEKVETALRRFVGSALRHEAEQDRSCRSRNVLNAVRSVLEGMAQLEGPKLVVVISSGLLNPRRDAPANRAPGPCEIRLDDFQSVGAAAARAGTHVTVVQPDDVTVDASTDQTLGRFASAAADREGLESLAGATEGEFVRIAGADDNSLRRLAAMTSGYYIATFEPEDAERTGATRRVQLSVRRESVQLRARRAMVIARIADREAAPKPADEMLRDGVLYRALPLRLTAYTSLGAGDKVNVVAALDPAEPHVTLTSAVFGLIDQRGKLVGKWTAGSGQLRTSPIVSAGEVGPGQYRLRAVAIDATGRRGSVEYEVRAGLQDAGPLRLSDVVLGTMSDSRFLPKLLFGSEQSVVVMLDAYGAPAIADSVSARLELTTDGHTPIRDSVAGKVALVADDRRMITGALPIASLAPGDYIVRVIVSIAGRPVGEATRILRKAPAGM